MTTFVYGPTPGRAWLNLQASRDEARCEALRNPLVLRLPKPRKRKVAA